ATDVTVNLSDLNETISAGSGITVNQSGEDFEVVNTAPDQTVSLADGGNGNVTIGGTYPNFTIDVPNATVDTDDQNATEVPIFPTEDTNTDTVIDENDNVTLDLDGDLGVDPDGSGPLEAPGLDDTVQEALEAIAPITSKAARIFYPPSISIDVSAYSGTNITGETKDLYQEYINQYAPTAPPFTDTFVGSTGAPSAIPTYDKTELYYYVTFYDDSVFDNVSIDADGVMTYDIVGTPADYNSLINVVFVVK
ncbi:MULTISPECIES: hypothetical protein, partial [unclassified Croceitalea]|uniref:hypothetical protein n=1 Tax=unclassified Croceitalea TaxID=2632280 RepID=UPI0030DCD4F6